MLSWRNVTWICPNIFKFLNDLREIQLNFIFEKVCPIYKMTLLWYLTETGQSMTVWLCHLCQLWWQKIISGLRKMAETLKLWVKLLLLWCNEVIHDIFIKKKFSAQKQNKGGVDPVAAIKKWIKMSTSPDVFVFFNDFIEFVSNIGFLHTFKIFCAQLTFTRIFKLLKLGQSPSCLNKLKTFWTNKTTGYLPRLRKFTLHFFEVISYISSKRYV